MKKIMIALAIACAASFAQAAAVTWDSSTLYTAADAEGGFSSTKIADAATGYLFVLTSAEYNQFLADYNANGDMSSVYEAYKDSLAQATATATSSKRGSSVKFETSADVGADVYAAVIYTYTDAKLGDFYIANIGTGNVGSDAGITVSNLGTHFLGDSAGVAAGGWQPVPEPTSGLLMLLGVAGLALRRRRA